MNKAPELERKQLFSVGFENLAFEVQKCGVYFKQPEDVYNSMKYYMTGSLVTEFGGGVINNAT